MGENMKNARVTIPVQRGGGWGGGGLGGGGGGEINEEPKPGLEGWGGKRGFSMKNKMRRSPFFQMSVARN